MMDFDNQPKNFALNNLLAVIAILLILISTGSTYLVYKKSQHRIFTGMATGRVELCLNHIPEININCTNIAYLDETYLCQVNVTEYDYGSNLSYYTNSTLFNITQRGLINFTPTTRNHEYLDINITVNDGSVCENSNSSFIFNLTITPCKEPIWNKFKNQISTNLSNYSCWDLVENLTLGIPGKGQIKFTSPSDINGYNLDRYVDIIEHRIFWNASGALNLNKQSYITFFNLTFIDPLLFVNNGICFSPQCINMQTVGNLTKNTTAFVSGPGNYSLKEKSNLTISDESDSYAIYNNQTLTFYAYYRYLNNTPVSDGKCLLRVNYTDHWNNFENMNFNSNISMFTFIRRFNSQGTFQWEVLCNKTDYYTIEANDSFKITNRRPILIVPIPNLTWNEDTILSGIDLDDYFMDPDNDELNYTVSQVSNIQITIDAKKHTVIFEPDRDFYGERIVFFYAFDPFNLSEESNPVYLRIIDVPEAEISPPAAGGGGAGIARICEENWLCGSFGPCLPTNIMVRTCTDMTECGTTKLKPYESMPCIYIPTCSDGLKNQDEEGVDCGGPCEPCPTCSDGIKNQIEDDVDCGGPCLPCKQSLSMLVISQHTNEGWQINNLDYSNNVTYLIADKLKQLPYAKWIKDSGKIIFIKDANIFIADRFGKAAEQVTNITNITKIRGVSQGKAIISFGVLENNIGKIYLLQGKKIKMLDLNVSAYFPDIAQNSGKIFFSTGYYEPTIEKNGLGTITGMEIKTIIESKIYFLALDRNELTLINTTKNAYAPSISPDGKKITYFSEGLSGGEIWLFNLETQENKKLVDDDFNNIFPIWTTNGEKIVFVSNKKGTYGVYTTDDKGNVLEKYSNQNQIAYSEWFISSYCNDNILNQLEEGVDCGGPCRPCIACNDGIQNNGEEGIDCGGPCASCQKIITIEQPKPRRNYLRWILILLALIPVFILGRRYGPRIYLQIDSRIKKYIERMIKKRLTPEEIEVYILRKLVELEKKAQTEPIPECLDELVLIMRGFITNVFGIDYAFTYEELQNELTLHKINPVIKKNHVLFFKKLEDMRFNVDEIDKKTALNMIDQAKKLVETIIVKETIPAQKIAAKKASEAIELAKKYIKTKDFTSAKEQYTLMIKHYNIMNEIDKDKIYKEIKEVHSIIKKGENE